MLKKKSKIICKKKVILLKLTYVGIGVKTSDNLDCYIIVQCVNNIKNNSHQKHFQMV